MKFIDPLTPKDEMKTHFDDLHQAIQKGFHELQANGMRV